MSDDRTEAKEELPLDGRSGIRFDRNFVWSVFSTVAGADSALLYGTTWRSPYYNRWDVPYFVGAGGAVLATGTLAAFSGSIFAAFLFSDGKDVSQFWYVGALLALMVIGIDRWLISDPDVGFSLSPAIKTTVQWWTVWFSNFVKETLKLSPRLALTLVMAFLFAEPLLLLWYKADIHAQMVYSYTNQVSALADAFVSEQRIINSTAQTALDSLNAEKETLDPNLRSVIDETNASIKKEIEDGNGTSRGGTCGQVCEDLKDALDGYQSQLASEQSAWSAQNAAEYTLLNSQIQASAPYINLTSSQATTLGLITCTYPGTTAPPYPEDLTAGTALTIPCPNVSGSVVERKIAFDQLINPTQSYVLADTQLSEDDKATVTSGISFNVALLRSFLIGIDILPVLMKFVRGILPKAGYYLAVSARQTEVDGRSAALRDAAQQELTASLEATAQASVIERELRTLEYERMLKTVHESRIRLGLRRIRDFVQDLAERMRKTEVIRTDSEPPFFQRDDLVPPPTYAPKRPSTTPPATPYRDSSDPRSLDDF